MNGPSVSSQNASPSLSACDAWKIALRGWAWGAGIGVGAGLLFGLWNFSNWKEMSLVAVLAILGQKAAFVAGLALPFCIAWRIEKSSRPSISLEQLGLYLTATLPIPPLSWLCTWDRDTVGFAALSVAAGAWVLLYPFYQRATGITSGLYSRYYGLAPLVSRRLGMRNSLLMAGYVIVFCLGLFSPILLGVLLGTWAGSGSASPTNFSPWGDYITLLLFFSTAELGATLRRHFPQESTWKLLVFFSFFVLAGGAILYWNDWVFFVKSKYLAMGYVPFALFWFATASTTGARRDAPVQGGNHDPAP